MTITVIETHLIFEATAVVLRQNLGNMLNRVQYRRNSILITKDGKPVAALVDAAMFERIRALRGRFDALSERMARGYEAVAENEGMAQIERIGAQTRRKTAREWRAAERLPAVATPSPAKPPQRAAANRLTEASKAKPAGTTGRH